MNNKQKVKQSWNTLPWTSKTCDEENILNLVHWRKRDFRCGWSEVGYTIVSRNPPPPFALHLESMKMTFYLEFHKNENPLMWAVGLISGFLHLLLPFRIYNKMGAPKSKSKALPMQF